MKGNQPIACADEGMRAFYHSFDETEEISSSYDCSQHDHTKNYNPIRITPFGRVATESHQTQKIPADAKTYDTQHYLKNRSAGNFQQQP